MKYIISAFVWIVGSISLIIALFLIILMSYLMPARKYDPLGKALFRWLFFMVGVRVTVEGKSHIDPNQTYVLMANHVSAFDIP